MSSSSKSKRSLDNQLSDIRKLLNESQPILDQHLTCLSQCSKQIDDSSRLEQKFETQFNDLESQLNTLREKFQTKLGESKTSTLINKLLQSTTAPGINSASSTPSTRSAAINSPFTDLQHVVISGKNLIEALSDGKDKQDLAKNLESVVESFR